MVSIIYFIHVLAANAAATWSNEYKGSQYYISYDSLASFENAKTACSSLDPGALLVTIKTEGVQRYLESILRESENAFPTSYCDVTPSPGDIFYIGLNYVGTSEGGNYDDYKWVDGTKLCESSSSPSWANWASGQPTACTNQYNCVVMSGNKWYRSLCTEKEQYICERPVVASSTKSTTSHSTANIDEESAVTSPSPGMATTSSFSSSTKSTTTSSTQNMENTTTKGESNTTVIITIIVVVILILLLVAAAFICLWRKKNGGNRNKVVAPLSFTASNQERLETNDAQHIEPVYTSTAPSNEETIKAQHIEPVYTSSAPSKEETIKGKKPMPKYSVVKKRRKYENIAGGSTKVNAHVAIPPTYNTINDIAMDENEAQESENYSTVKDAVQVKNISGKHLLEDAEKDSNPYNIVNDDLNGENASAGFSNSKQRKINLYDAVSKPNNYEDIKDLAFQQDNENHYSVAKEKSVESDEEAFTVYDVANFKEDSNPYNIVNDALNGENASAGLSSSKQNFVAEEKYAENDNEASTVYDNAKLTEEKSAGADVYNQLGYII